MNRPPAGFLVVTLTAFWSSCTPDVQDEPATDAAALATPPSALDRATSYTRNGKFGLGTTDSGRAREWQYDLSPPVWKLRDRGDAHETSLRCIHPDLDDDRCWLGQELELPVHIAARGSAYEIRLHARESWTDGPFMVRVRDLDTDTIVDTWNLTQPANQWIEHVLTGTLPAGSSHLRLVIRAPRNAYVDDVAFNVEESIEQDGMCAASPSSPVGDAIAAALAAYIPAGAPISRKGECNSLAADAWISSPPVDAVAGDGLLEGHEEFLHRAQDLIRRTESRLQIVTLAFDDTTLAYIGEALRDLHESQAGREGPYPLIQLLQSNPPAGSGGGLLGNTPKAILKEIREAMAGIPEHRWRFYLAIRSVSKQGVLSFNHAKIVLRDREEAIVGGHNWSSYVLALDPIHHDASLHVRGDAARIAGDMFDVLWLRAIIDGEPDVFRCVGSESFDHLRTDDGKRFGCTPGANRVDHAEIARTNHIPPLPPSEVHGPLPIYGLGRGVVAVPGFDGLLTSDFSADHAIVAALDSSTESIRLLQHSLKNPVIPFADFPVPQVVKESLWRAVFERQLPVEVLISDEWIPYPEYHPVTANSDPQSVVDALYDGAGAFALANYPADYATEEAALAQLDCLLSVARFQAPGWPGEHERNHAKVVFVDDAAVYVGSQNLYTQEFLETFDGSDPGQQLADFGFFVDDAAFAESVKETVWDVVWDSSEPHRVLPPGRTAGVVNPATGTCIPICDDPAAPFYNPDTGVCEPCPADTPNWDPDLGLCVGGCPGGTAAGGDAGVVRAFELGQAAGTFDFAYEHYTVMDRTIVRYEGATLYDTGCTGGFATVPLSYSGVETHVVVEVVPNCAGTSGTAWTFSVSCPIAP